jgi:hypothetical protein
MKKVLASYRPDYYNTEESRKQSFFNSLKGKPFWVWGPDDNPEDPHNHIAADIATKGECCFNHMIGLPVKTGRERPLYTYQKIILDALDKHKHVFIKKATGLGISELMLRFMAWLSLKDNTYYGSQMIIITGPRIDLSITLIERMKRLFESAEGVHFSTKETVIELNGVHIEALPSHHLSSARGLPNVSFILLDEGDFFNPREMQEARDVSERYIAKSDPYIVMVSTPNLPGGLFEKIELEPEDTCLYKRLFLDYTKGLGKIYSVKEIEEAKTSPSFEREYNLSYGYGLGNIVLPSEIDRATVLGKAMESISPDNIHTYKTLGIDAGFGNSKFAFVVSEAAIDGKARVIHSAEYERPRQEVMLDIAYDLIIRYNIDKVYVDAANVSFIKSLKQWFTSSEVVDYERDSFIHSRRIVPVAFGSGNGTKMVSHLKDIFSKGLIAIHLQKHEQLITQIRVAKILENGNLDKTASNITFDLFDAFRLSLIRYTEDGIEIIRRK